MDWLQIRVDVKTGCWLWTGTKFSNGYARLGSKHVHRTVYLALVGEIPHGFHVDHLCRVRHCVNPKHLEAVPPRVNILRGVGAPAQNARKTHCVRGHKFDYDRPDGARGCAECRRVASREWKRRTGYRPSPKKL